ALLRLPSLSCCLNLPGMRPLPNYLGTEFVPGTDRSFDSAAGSTCSRRTRCPSYKKRFTAVDSPLSDVCTRIPRFPPSRRRRPGLQTAVAGRCRIPPPAATDKMSVVQEEATILRRTPNTVSHHPPSVTRHPSPVTSPRVRWRLDFSILRSRAPTTRSTGGAEKRRFAWLGFWPSPDYRKRQTRLVEAPFLG
ncbi:MAG: hypothetical protein RLY70_3062, partial [Planctomycetota bacterium]